MAMAQRAPPQRRRPRSKSPRPYTYSQTVPRWIVPPQTRIWLEQVFATVKLPTHVHREQLAVNLGITERQIQVWFQNRRQLDRRGRKAALETTGLDAESGRPPLTAVATVDTHEGGDTKPPLLESDHACFESLDNLLHLLTEEDFLPPATEGSSASEVFSVQAAWYSLVRDDLEPLAAHQHVTVEGSALALATPHELVVR